VTCQGYSLNQIIVWNKRGKRELIIHGHSERVLYSALSPSGEHLATGAGDQQLKIWRLFPRKDQDKWEPNGLR
jgi:cell division cycle 20-like protein 1 (cofactor of APC complex)